MENESGESKGNNMEIDIGTGFMKGSSERNSAKGFKGSGPKPHPPIPKTYTRSPNPLNPKRCPFFCCLLAFEGLGFSGASARASRF